MLQVAGPRCIQVTDLLMVMQSRGAGLQLGESEPPGPLDPLGRWAHPWGGQSGGPPLVCPAPAVLTWGSPVRRLARLGEQLLTEVKAWRKSRLRRARASRWGVAMTLLL